MNFDFQSWLGSLPYLIILGIAIFYRIRKEFKKKNDDENPGEQAPDKLTLGTEPKQKRRQPVPQAHDQQPVIAYWELAVRRVYSFFGFTSG